MKERQRKKLEAENEQLKKKIQKLEDQLANKILLGDHSRKKEDSSDYTQKLMNRVLELEAELKERDLRIRELGVLK